MRRARSLALGIGSEAAEPSASRARTIAAFLLATLGTAAVCAAFLNFRADLRPLSEGFGFLALVVLTVTIGGLVPGVLASLLSFLVFNFYFLPPYGTFRIQRPDDIVVLFGCLGLSVLISILISRANARASAAEARERELRIQQDLTRALVDPRAPEESYDLVMRAIVARFQLTEVVLMIQPRGDLGGLEEAAAIRRSPATGPVPATIDERLALNVGRRNLGLLILQGERDPLSPAERRILDAFCNQLALVLERDRILRSAVEAGGGRAT